MNLDEVIALWQEDAKINETELSRESVNTPKLHAKYLEIYSAQRLKLRSLKLKQKELVVKLTDYYRGDLNNPEDLKEIGRDPWPKKILKQEVSSYVEADDEMIKLNVKTAYQQEMVDVLNEIIASINKRSFHINNAINFLKFTHGD